MYLIWIAVMTIPRNMIMGLRGRMLTGKSRIICCLIPIMMKFP